MFGPVILYPQHDPAKLLDALGHPITGCDADLHTLQMTCFRPWSNEGQE